MGLSGRSIAKMNKRNKTIWIFWYQGYYKAPELIKMCIHSWERFHPDYEIIVLDQHSLFDYIELPVEINVKREDITVQKISALCRLAILRKYGGIWADATVYCCTNIDEWLPENLNSHFFAFRNPGKDRMMSNWFMVSDTESKIIQTLYKEFAFFFADNSFSNQHTFFGRHVIKILSSLLNTSPENTLFWHSRLVTKILKVYPYFIFHYTFNKVVIEDKGCREEWDLTGEFNADIPHALQHIFHKKEENQIKQALAHIEKKLSPVYKLNWRDDMEHEYWKNVLSSLNLIT